jgi:hypothetical protein
LIPAEAIAEVVAALLPAAGDEVAWSGDRYQVVAHAANGQQLAGWRDLPGWVADYPDQITVVVDGFERLHYAPTRDVTVLRTNPNYVAERLMEYLSARMAIDWDQDPTTGS